MAKSEAQYCDVWLIRHGEREDEVPGNTWGRGETRKLWFDPPLTRSGSLHARDVAKEFKNRLGICGRDVPSEMGGSANTAGLNANTNTAGGGFNAIYASPLVRAAMTASQFSAELGLPLVIVPGLSTCAAAIQAEGLRREGSGSPPSASAVLPNRSWFGTCWSGRGTEASSAKPEDTVQASAEELGRLVLNSSGLKMRSMEELQAMCPESAGKMTEQPQVESFQATMERLCLEHLASHATKSHALAAPSPTAAAPPRILCVAHREGIRDLSAVAKGVQVRKTPYTCVANFRFWRLPDGRCAWEALGCEALVPFAGYHDVQATMM